MKKRILLLTTGGTIASQDGGNGLAPVLSSDDFLDYMKEFEDVCELVPYEVCSIDSTNMEASWWLKLAGLIQKNYTLYDAFLICHGTYPMAENDNSFQPLRVSTVYSPSALVMAPTPFPSY